MALLPQKSCEKTHLSAFPTALWALKGDEQSQKVLPNDSWIGLYSKSQAIANRDRREIRKGACSRANGASLMRHSS
jgi:hypothetical protein